MNGSEGSDRGRVPMASSTVVGGPTNEEMMQFIDGELDPGRASEVTAFLLQHPLERAALQRMLTASDIIVGAVLDRADSSGVDSIGASVMAQLDGLRGSGTVATRRPGLRSVRYLVPVAGVLGFAMAAAAACFIWLRLDHRTDLASHLSKLRPADDIPAAKAVKVEAVDFGSRAGTIYYVTTSADKAPTPVIWVTDETRPVLDSGE